MSGLKNHNTIHGGNRKRLPLISVVLIAGFLGFTLFILVYVLLRGHSTAYDGEVAAPSVIIADIDTAIINDATHETHETNEIHETNETHETNDTKATNTTNEPGENQNESVYADSESYSIIQMDTFDINSGYLILVNDDHAYSIPDDLDLRRIVDEVSPDINVQLDGFHLLRSVMAPLNEMMLQFLSATDDRSVYIVGAYRSYEIQQAILAQHGDRASPVGHSEHHTGLAFDFGIFHGGERSTFKGTGSTAWLLENSYKYGFIPRYPEDKTHITGVQFEPWHFRFVGLPHSYIMFQNNWVLEEYIELLRGYTFEEPFIADYDGVTYRIYFTENLDISVPIDMEYDISGNNVDGFIVTVRS